MITIQSHFGGLMPKRSPEMLMKLFESRVVLELKDMQTVLADASRATTFRYLKRIPHHRSYNYNGRYYTRQDPTRHDRFGIFSVRDIHFSRDTTLGETIKRLVCEAISGWTMRELQDLLRVRIQVMLLAAFRRHTIERQKVGGFYVYLHPEPTIREAQLQRRRELIASREMTLKDAEIEVSDAVIIEILLTLIRHPEAKAADAMRYLRGHSPPISMHYVSVVFARYDLDDIGEKGGDSNC